MWRAMFAEQIPPAEKALRTGATKTDIAEISMRLSRIEELPGAAR